MSLADMVTGLFGSGSRAGRAYAITLLIPVRPEAAPKLKEYLAKLGIGEKSPLSKVASVHFARWVVIDQLKTDWPGAPTPKPRLNSPYLLFTASLTVPKLDPSQPRYAKQLPKSFLYELQTSIPDTVDAIWGHCVGYPAGGDPDAIVRWLARGQITTSLFHVGYADVPVDEVRWALALRDSFVAFARDHQGVTDPQRLQDAYRKESKSWFP